jgi:hypothetical protein
VENSLLLPPVGVWTVLSSSQADHPLRPATDRRLGEPLPHQQANQTQATPKAHKALLRRAYAALATLSGSYSSLWGMFLRVTLPSAARHQSEDRAAARLACIRHAASVHPEPGSNSPLKNRFKKICADLFEITKKEIYLST